ncbi:MAG: glutamate cyclase domain-containing protein [Sneathiella sp.]
MLGNTTPPSSPPKQARRHSSSSDEDGLLAPVLASEETVQNFSRNLGNICFVDSGVGGAMAAMQIPGFVVEFGSNVCLPIGDKTHELITTYTAQMMLEGLIGQDKDSVIIACNTASTTLRFALPIVEKFILQQIERPKTSIYPLDGAKMNRLKQLAKRIGEGHQHEYLTNHIFGIVKPTAIAAADIIRRLLETQDNVCIRIESTIGTAKSGAYLEEIADNLFEGKSFPHYKNGNKNTQLITRNATEHFPAQAINNMTLEFNPVREDDRKKTVFIQNRGNQEWVPAIEKKELGRFAGIMRRSEAATKDACNDAPDHREFHREFAKSFKRVPDLTMLCCTHFPAFRQTIENTYDEYNGGQLANANILQQDEVALALAIKIAGGDLQDERFSRQMVELQRKTSALYVTLGDSNLTEKQLQQKKDILSAVFERSNGITVEALNEYDGIDYRNIHKQISYLRRLQGEDQRPDQPQRYFFDPATRLGHDVDREANVLTAWMVEINDHDPQRRYDAQFIDGMPQNSVALQTIKTALNLFPIVEQAHDDLSLAPYSTRATPKIRRLFSAISQLGRLGTLGEKRGIDILGIRYDPGQCLIEAAGMMAEIVKFNAGPALAAAADADRPAASVAIVTGFTVVDAQGRKVCGENDGPPGAVMLASSLLSQGVLVTLVIDTGAESSLISALLAANLARLVGEDVTPMVRTVKNIQLENGLEIECIQHDLETHPERNSLEGVRHCIANLQHKNTKLVIAIERPSPNVSGGMSSMSGASITKFNADMSPLFESDLGWKTIGIGDGGNEIGTAGAKTAVTRARKPDGTLVVNNGDKIAALAETDVMVLSSVSNNGGLFLSIAFEMILGELGLNSNIRDRGAEEVTSQDLIQKMCIKYATIIVKMFNEKMSMDGVNKINAMTVDGRRLLRGRLANGITTDQRPCHPGDADATHEDMFDVMCTLIEKSGISISDHRFVNEQRGPFSEGNSETVIRRILGELEVLDESALNTPEKLRTYGLRSILTTVLRTPSVSLRRESVESGPQSSAIANRESYSQALQVALRASREIAEKEQAVAMTGVQGRPYFPDEDQKSDRGPQYPTAAAASRLEVLGQVDRSSGGFDGEGVLGEHMEHAISQSYATIEGDEERRRQQRDEPSPASKPNEEMD